MPIFKRDLDVLDLTDLQKRGILKKAEHIKKQEPTNDGYADLTPSTPSLTPENQFDFLDTLANASTSSTPSPTSNTDFQHLNVKLEDMEYKLDRFLERLEALEIKMRE